MKYYSNTLSKETSELKHADGAHGATQVHGDHHADDIGLVVCLWNVVLKQSLTPIILKKSHHM